MKIKDLAKLLYRSTNVSANIGEVLQFIRSPQYHEDEDNEGNIIEDFLTFRKTFDADLIDDSFIKYLNNNFTPSVIPKKIQKQIQNEFELGQKYYEENDDLKYLIEDKQ